MLTGSREVLGFNRIHTAFLFRGRVEICFDLHGVGREAFVFEGLHRPSYAVESTDNPDGRVISYREWNTKSPLTAGRCEGRSSTPWLPADAREVAPPPIDKTDLALDPENPGRP